MYSSHTSKRPQHRLNADEKRRLAADLATNVPIKELAATYGITPRSVQRFAARLRRDPAARIESKPLVVRMEADEIAALDVLAGRMGLSRSALARAALRQVSGFFEPDEDLIQIGTDLNREAKRIGNNLNQLAYHANRKALVSGRADISPADLAAIVNMRDELKQLSDLVTRLLVTKAKRRRGRLDQILKGLE